MNLQQQGDVRAAGEFDLRPPIQSATVSTSTRRRRSLSVQLAATFGMRRLFASIQFARSATFAATIHRPPRPNGPAARPAGSDRRRRCLRGRWLAFRPKLRLLRLDRPAHARPARGGQSGAGLTRAGRRGSAPSADRPTRAARLLWCEIWRSRWDSNPRYPCEYGGFQDRCLKPLGHRSGGRPASRARGAAPADRQS